jgi:polar amino acid transport system substrate-binding protein
MTITTRRKFLLELGALVALPLSAWSGSAQAGTLDYDFSPEQHGRVRAPVNPAAQRAAAGYRWVSPGSFTAAVAPFAAPISSYASDARTLVGSDPDFAQLVADALGLKLALVPVAWEDWPLGLSSGKYDAVIANVGVTEKRKQKFDFSTYRLGLHGFYVANGSPIQAIREPKDIAGLRVITGSGTIQERILLQWNQRNVAHGLKPASFQYLQDLSSTTLAIVAGRADAVLGPHAVLSYAVERQGKLRLVGTINAGWPERADVAVATRKGSGLADAVTLAANGLIAGGQYRAALARWGLESEAIPRAETNPPGYRDLST